MTAADLGRSRHSLCVPVLRPCRHQLIQPKVIAKRPQRLTQNALFFSLAWITVPHGPSLAMNGVKRSLEKGDKYADLGTPRQSLCLGAQGTQCIAPPFRPRSPPALPFRAPEHRLPIERSRSPAGQPPSKRSRLADIDGTLTMGPLESSNLSPRELLTSLVSGALPSFDLATVSHVMLDPVYPYHLRVTLPSSFAVDNLIAMWNTGSRTTRMRALTTNNDSASFGPTRGRSPIRACEDAPHSRCDQRESSSTVCREPFHDHSYRGSSQHRS
ncbi:hypothetical protein C8J57DRAFT_1570735 [Mycena rebaudengoi]|nr:hypothetical protein C8J57DRAFT_1570735 [Mycena rebaudengoi]